MSPMVWLIIGMVSILAEVIIVPGIGFLFAGLGAISLGGLLTFNFLHEKELLSQVAYFFFLTGVWWVVLWKPLKKLNNRRSGEGYNNLSDAQGTVAEEGGLVAGKIGHVKWSGAAMRARIRPGASGEKIDKGEAVWVHEQKDGILLVDVTRSEK